jgi:hypothetical protein
MNPKIEPLAVILLVATIGCGGEGGSAGDVWVDRGEGGGPLAESSLRDTEAVAQRVGARGVPLVYISRLDGQRGKYVYRLQGEEYQEREFLGLCRTMRRDTPDLLVRIVPNAMLSDDEVGLISARIHETGIDNLKVLSTTGEERR